MRVALLIGPMTSKTHRVKHSTLMYPSFLGRRTIAMANKSMKYEIAGEGFATKKEIIRRCQRILAGPSPVAATDRVFLVALFEYHHHWTSEKVGCGVEGIEVRPVMYGQKGFYLIRPDGSEIDISFMKAVGDIPTGRKQIPQAVKDFKAAAREVVVYQVRDYRDSFLRPGLVCPVTGEDITRANVHVDHVAPKTFDRLLFGFCQERQINPAQVAVGSVDGVVPVFEDPDLSLEWEVHHAIEADLRLTSAAGNLKTGTVRLPWEELYAPNDR